MKTKLKFSFEIIIIILFTIFCTIIEIPWWYTLRDCVGSFLATLIIIGLAFFPGIMVMLVLWGIILDKPKRRQIIYEDLTDITILIAAYNEEASIYDTVKSIAQQQYTKNIIVKIIDNNSKDNTKQEILRAIQDFPQLQVEYIFESTQGKFAALNNGLAQTTTPYVITLDADTFLHDGAIELITNAIIQENKERKVGAIAGALFVKNANVNLLTKMQEWEYYLSIAGIKRAQGLYETTLVAQGAFSIYDTALLKEIGGWKDSIGEDIVLTWEILTRDYKTLYEDCALAYTNAPTDVIVFMRQRARWARGMIEGFRHFSFKRCNNTYAKCFIFADYFLFIIDFSVSFFFIPGLLIGLILHNYLIVGPMTLILFPITLFMFGIMLLSQWIRVSKTLNIKLSHNLFGLLAYILFYSILLSPTCIYGYIQEFLGTTRKWR